MNSFSSSPTMQRLLIGLSALIILIGTFALGVNLGERKARHFSGWYENYGGMFHEHTPSMPKLGQPFPSRMPDAHGVFGKILSVSDTNFVIQGKDGIEQNVLVTSSTVIRIGNERTNMTDLHEEEILNLNAAAFGAPNGRGQIEARLIRLFTQP